MRKREPPPQGGVFALGSEPGGDVSASTTAEQRLALMWPLALEAWALTGRELPAYDRASTPVRVTRLSHRAVDRTD